MRIGPERIGEHLGIAAVALGPASEKRSRKRSSCIGLIAYTGKPRSIRLSTTGP